MEITREVIIDLLPLYLANEVSEETRAVIEKYLETDLGLAKLAKQQKAALALPGDIPVPLTEEAQLKAYRKSRIYFYVMIVILAILMAAILGITFLAFFIPS